MKDDGVPQPVLVAFPEEGGGQRVMLDPGYFHGLDEVGTFLADLARHYGRAFVQSGRAQDMNDAIDQIEEVFAMQAREPIAAVDPDDVDGHGW
ncbi:MAG: DUF5076 domain-containing protein [Pseudomonadota bacterium]